MNELKPCPFCGGKFPTIHISIDKRYILNSYGKGLLTDNDAYEIACRICGCRTAIWTDEGKAIEAWNRRAEDDK